MTGLVSLEKCPLRNEYSSSFFSSSITLETHSGKALRKFLLRLIQMGSCYSKKSIATSDSTTGDEAIVEFTHSTVATAQNKVTASDMGDKIEAKREQVSKELQQEFTQYFYDQNLVLVLGNAGSGKSTIINGIHRQSEENMKQSIVSQYEIDNFGIVTEYTIKSIQNHAAQNMKYFSLFKDKWSDLIAILSKMEEQHTTLKPIKNTTSIVYDYSLLFSGFIHQSKSSQDAYIPQDVITIISRYFVSNLLDITSYKVPLEESDQQIFEIWESTGIDIKYWENKLKRIKGIIYIIDLTSYDEYFVDEDGIKKNKLEYSLKVWKNWSWVGKIDVLQKYCNDNYNHEAEMKQSRLVFLTKKDLFTKKVKKIPLSVCPMFKDYVGLNTLSKCLGPIKATIETNDPYEYNRVYCINSYDRIAVSKYFKSMLHSMADSSEIAWCY